MTPERLRDALAALGWTQSAAAKRLGVTDRAVRFYLAGQRRIPARHAETVEAAMAEIGAMEPAKLRAALRALQLDQVAAAERLGLSAQDLHAMLAGRRTVPVAVRQALRAMF